MGLEDQCILFSAREKTSELGTKAQWRELFGKVVVETMEGVSFEGDLIVVGGGKMGRWVLGFEGRGIGDCGADLSMILIAGKS